MGFVEYSSQIKPDQILELQSILNSFLWTLNLLYFLLALVILIIVFSLLSAIWSKYIDSRQRMNQNSQQQIIDAQLQIFQKRNGFSFENIQIQKLETDEFKQLLFGFYIYFKEEMQISSKLASSILENPYQNKIRQLQQEILKQPSDYSQNQMSFMKIRLVILKLMFKYQEQQCIIFKLLQAISQTILNGEFVYSEMIETYKHHTTNYQQDKDGNQGENYQILVQKIKKIKFQRILKMDCKYDQLELVVDHLNKKLLIKNPMTLITVISIDSNTKLYLQDYNHFIYFDKNENFCYFTKYQMNHFYNLQETLGLAIYQSGDFKNSKLSFDAFLQKLAP